MGKYSVGSKFGHLTITDIPKKKKGTNQRYVCECDCPKKTLVERSGSSLHRYKNINCGCIPKVRQSRVWSVKKLPGYKKSINTSSSFPREYKTWQAMLRRCYAHTYSDFRLYGGKGVIVCERWHCFDNFLFDMGKRPEGHSLDRKDSDNLVYSKENCEWADIYDQNRNRNVNIKIQHNGKLKKLKDVAAETGEDFYSLRERVRKKKTKTV